MPHADPAAVARASYMAYVENDRSALEKLIADDFRFTSPLDNGLDRATYFARCWPNAKEIAGFEFVRIAAAGDAVFVTYVGEARSGQRFRNTEVLTVRDGKIAAVEVYFGWNVPHDAPAGGFIST
jgi:ketosteroid isomerase-like protein